MVRKVLLNEIFETTNCSRCDGTGHYSYNTRDGSRCFGCGGRGWVFTKRGQTARDAWLAAWKRTTIAEQVKPGDRVAYFDTMRGKRFVFTVESSEADDLNVGQNRWNLRFDQPAALGGLGLYRTSEVELPASMDEKQAAYETISHMPGATGWKEQD